MQPLGREWRGGEVHWDTGLAISSLGVASEQRIQIRDKCTLDRGEMAGAEEMMKQKERYHGVIRDNGG